MFRLAPLTVVLAVLFAGACWRGLTNVHAAFLQTQQEAPRRVRVSADVAQKLVAKSVPPHYPKEAREQDIQGSVLMNVIITKDGDVAKCDLASGHPALAQAAIDAVKRWKYRPYLLNGEPVEIETQVKVNFTLSGH